MGGLKRLFQQFTSQEKWFILFSMATAFFIALEYAMTRPSSSSIFLTVFSSHAIPWVWLISVPFNLGCVYLYNRYLPVLGPVRMLGSIAAIISFVHLFCAAALTYIPQFIFVQFIWKDIYILLMFKQLWSMIHSTIPASRAKYLYGVIFSMGTVGSVLGSIVPGFYAVGIGSEKIFLASLPIYFLLYLCYKKAFACSSLRDESFAKDLTEDLNPKGGFSLIGKSPFLIAVLILVVFMQISIGLMDYLFNAHLEQHVTDLDLRTEYVGRIIGITNLCSGVFQLIGGFLMVHFLGVRGGHLFVPLLLLCNSVTAWLFPTFSVISLSYILIKSIDFSLFGVIREMLYIPMKLDEKFRAKAIIDVFAYRSAKALIAVCILLLQVFVGKEILQSIHLFSIAVFLAWIGVVFFLLKKVAPDFYSQDQVNK
ncbi:MAG TPA: Npt1/Npt2 family nucleotide transporter [Chlamydiales bacterium]|nr:MAG: hypothetical protein A3F67_10300 [Verrucomicrobia bacterium RIFCSPHIGHO2_12_FULL_41_10]HLB52648.1 Npt1/Npt2 family nucleotide transporter [Chlamydiales bacterium]